MNRAIILFALAGACALFAFAASSIHATNPAITADVVYGRAKGTKLTFDVFRPRDQNGAGIIRLVSGGYRSAHTPAQQVADQFEPFYERGYTVFNVRHGSNPQFNVVEIHEQIRRAVRTIRKHAHEYGVDSERLGIMGSSSGGHLALLIGLAPDEGKADVEDAVMEVPCRVAAVVAFAAPVDLRDVDERLDRWQKAGGDDAERAARLRPAYDFDPVLRTSLSPILQVTPDDPPTLLIHGSEDHVVPPQNSRKLYAELQLHGVPSELIILEGNSHRDWSQENQRRQIDASLDWFDQHLKHRRN